MCEIFFSGENLVTSLWHAYMIENAEEERGTDEHRTWFM